MTTYSVTLRYRGRVAPGLRWWLRELHMRGPPSIEGLGARAWTTFRLGLLGHYLFHDRDLADAFVGDPAAVDPDVASLATARGVSLASPPTIEALDRAPIVRPIILASAPRAGSTLLFDALCASDAVWSIGGESHSVVEGIPRLHPRNRGFVSHALDEADADPETVELVRHGFIVQLRNRRGQRLLELSPGARPAVIRMVEKTPENALRLPFMLRAFPDAVVVHLVREPRQNVSSIVEAWGHQGFVNIPVLPGWPGGRWHLLLPDGWREYSDKPISEVAAFQWAAANEAILRVLDGLDDDRWCVIDFDELVQAPEQVMRRVGELAGLTLTDAAVRLKRPLAISDTTISPPSPMKWRFNARFSEEALDAFQHVTNGIERVRTRSGAVSVRRRREPVRFFCFLDELAAPAGSSDADVATVDSSHRLQFGVTAPLGLARRARFRERFLGGYPLAWVEDSATGSLRPFWVRPHDAWRLRALKPGMEAPSGTPESLRKALLAAELLVSAGANEARRRRGDEQAASAGAHFLEHDHCSLRGLLHPGHVRALARYYESLIASGAWQLGDDQVAGRYGWHNELLARFFHHQLAAYVSRVVGERVKASYAYVSAYRGGAQLERHLDREQCEFTMSLLVDQSPDHSGFRWPLYFDTEHGTVSLEQEIGDATLFRGTKLPHYRERLPEGHTSTSLLFHYVPAAFSRTLY